MFGFKIKIHAGIFLENMSYCPQPHFTQSVNIILVNIKMKLELHYCSTWPPHQKGMLVDRK